MKRGEKMDDLLMYAANFGFPMVVSAYLLVRIETRLGSLDRSIQDLVRTISYQLNTNK